MKDSHSDLWTGLPSEHQIDDVVSVVLPQGENSITVENCEVDAVRFYPGKVRYDVFVNLTPEDFERRTYIDNVDGDFLYSDQTKTVVSPELQEKIKGYLEKECAVVVNGQAIFGGKIFCVIFNGPTIYFDVAIPCAENPQAYYWLKEVHSGNVLTGEDLELLKTHGENLLYEFWQHRSDACPVTEEYVPQYLSMWKEWWQKRTAVAGA